MTDRYVVDESVLSNGKGGQAWDVLDTKAGNLGRIWVEGRKENAEAIANLLNAAYLSGKSEALGC